MKYTLRLVLVSTLIAVGGWTASAADSNGFISLFNGTNLEGWDGNPKFWSVRDGSITGQTTKENPTKGNTFIIWRAGTVDNFELRLQYRIVGGNSGIQYRSRDHGNWVVGGYQGDFESGNTFSGILYEERGRGILAQRGQLTAIHANGDKHRVEVVGSLGESGDIQSHIKKEDWNDYKIIADGHRFVHVINGRVTAIVVDHDEKNRRNRGVLALQLHAGPPMTVQFRDIKLRKLGPVQVAGLWKAEVLSDQGNGSPVFRFIQEENVLKGEYEGLFGKQAITGSVNGNQVTFSVSGEYEGQTMLSDYEGSVQPDGTLAGEMVLNQEITLEWHASMDR
ncbi:MAG: DUF1080 domain-containing protein [Verrucomicrobiota bacterium]|jgi:hypothetical protein|nr:DUF1080 domain-containing protein [Verrucomicrobiota bacterium]